MELRTMVKTLHVLAGLLFVCRFQISFLMLKSADGLEDTDASSPQEETMNELPKNHGSRGRREVSRLRSEAPGRRGHYRDQHRPEESDPDLVTEEGHNDSTQIVNIDHAYYTSKIYGPGDAAATGLWVNVEEMKRDEGKTQGFLTSTHRQAERVTLSFDFPFYGHMLREVTVATGGFIYTGDIIHRLLTATQYIAPLMADFDPSLSTNSTVFYFDNGTSLLVQWSRLHLQDDVRWGPFTFQAALHSDGRIIFAYKEIPVDISNISSENHPVKVGLSDAFVVLHKMEPIPNVRRRTIYEYHKVDILRSKVSSSTAVQMFPLPTCLQFSSCGPCVASQIGFNCSWCSRLHRCSSGFDRNRQDWVDLGCPDEKRDPRCVTATDVTNTSSGHVWRTTTPTTSGVTLVPLSWTSPSTNPSTRSSSARRTVSTPQGPTSRPVEDDTKMMFHSNQTQGQSDDSGVKDQRLQTGLLAGVVMVMVIMAAGVLMSVYMYNHPTSSVSLFFMERRPTRWPIMKFSRGSGRPSYAEVEAAGQDKDGTVVIDPKQSFMMTDRRESEQKEGFIVPDQRERFLVSESS